jgi:hypothetical protein
MSSGGPYIHAMDMILHVVFSIKKKCRMDVGLKIANPFWRKSYHKNNYYFVFECKCQSLVVFESMNTYDYIYD